MKKISSIICILAVLLTSGCSQIDETQTSLPADTTSVSSATSTTTTAAVSSTTVAVTSSVSVTEPEETTETISQTGSGGTLEEQIDNYIEATQEIADSEKEPVESVEDETSKPSSTSKTEVSKPTETTKPVQTTTSTYTVDDDDIEEVVVAPVTSSDVKTIGGYAPTTPNAQYQYEGFKFWNMDKGIVFREGEMKELRNWVEAGYTVEREVDVRIASRKGGVDNPRQFVLLGVDNNETPINAIRTDKLTLVTVFEGQWGSDNKIDQELVDITNSMKYWNDGTRNNYEAGRIKAAWEDYMSSHNAEQDLDICPGDTLGEGGIRTSVTYSYRNYCDEAIKVSILGNGVTKSYKNYNKDGSLFEEGVVAGVDYILTCDEDPDAFKLISGDEAKSYYYTQQIYGIHEAEMASLYMEGPNYLPDERGQLEYRNNYVGVKPGIYNCTVTIKATGEKIPIVIENLPYHYEKLQWGCTNQREMDACVAAMQFSKFGVNGQYSHVMRQDWCPTYMDVQLNAATLADKLETVDEFNAKGLQTYEGKTIQLKRTAEAAEWLAHLPTQYAKNYYSNARVGLFTRISTNLGKKCTSYDALDAIIKGANDCESYTSVMTCMYNVLGYSTRQWSGSNHTWFEVKIPASMVEGSNGEDLWLMVNDGRIVGHVGSTMIKSYKGEVCEGFDNSWWGKCFNEDISNWENMGVKEQAGVSSAQEYLELKATSLALVSGAGF